MNLFSNIKKILRFARIYGIKRTVVKALGRLRYSFVKYPSLIPRERNISIIGSGQFMFSTIAYYITTLKGNHFLDCYDLELNNAQTLHNFYSFKRVVTTPDQVFQNPKVKTIYIASNHATHTPYAVQSLRRGLATYIEKPIAVTQDQLIDLMAHIRKYDGYVFAGYNRPYSKAILELQEIVKNIPNHVPKPFSLTFFISGHLIKPNHWYRIPEEGTRICGNMGHWLDLTLHIFRWRSLPQWLDITIIYSNLKELDDNIIINFTTDLNDLVSITLTSRSEPYEGINETINFQYNNIIAKIDDFRCMDLWIGENFKRLRYFPKDVGHSRTVMQPFFDKKMNRDWYEIELSSLLMLHITDMVRNNTTNSRFIIENEWNEIIQKVETRCTQLIADMDN